MTRRPPAHVIVYEPQTWDQVLALGRQLTEFVFRGVPDATWDIKTSLERVADRYGFQYPDLPVREKKMVLHFQRAAHLYFPAQALPERADWLGWMSLAQHYGAPTRLLDFTESFYCSLFFAVDGADGTAAVWAVNRRVADNRSAELLGVEKDQKEVIVRGAMHTKINNGIEARTGVRAVLLHLPDRLHERLAHQQGLFLLSGRSDVPFKTQLLETLDVSKTDFASASGNPVAAVPPNPDLDMLQALHLVKIHIGITLHRIVRSQLRKMNITSASLFPGPEGYARSMAWDLGEFQPGEPDFIPANMGTAADLKARVDSSTASDGEER